MESGDSGIRGTNPNKYTSLILASPVQSLTMAQGVVAWFIFRQYSFTSSTVDCMAQARASKIFPDHERRKAYEIVFQHLGLERLLSAEEEAIQLQEYYDRMMQQRNAAYAVANPTGVARAAGLRIIFRETRQGLVQPLVEHTAPQVDSQSIPTGAPMALNPEIGMRNVGRRQSEQGRSPFLVQMTGRLTPSLNATRLPPTVDFRKICSTCRRSKSVHSGYKCLLDFGRKCKWPTCGRCGLPKTAHQNLDAGFYCEMGTTEGADEMQIADYSRMLNQMFQTSNR